MCIFVPAVIYDNVRKTFADVGLEVLSNGDIAYLDEYGYNRTAKCGHYYVKYYRKVEL